LEGGAEAGMAEEAGGCWCGNERECGGYGEEERGNEWKGEHRRGWVGVRAQKDEQDDEIQKASEE